VNRREQWEKKVVFLNEQERDEEILTLFLPETALGDGIV
jgi:hypothetical protein